MHKKLLLTKFLIIRFSSIGDIVLTTPVVRCLKQQVEDAEVHYLTKKQFAPVLSSNPYIDKIHLLDDNLSEIVPQLKKEHFDYLIDLHKNLRTFLVKNRLNVLTFSFDKLNVQKWLLVNFKMNRLPDVHIVDRYLKSVTLFDVKNDNQGLDYFIPPEDEMEVSSLPEDFSGGYIAFVIGAKHVTKQLSDDKIISICNRLQLPVILLGGEEDREKAARITGAVKGNILNACGKYSINQSASLVKQARAVITHDTGLMHIAAAFNRKIISVWGNTIPGFGMYPYMTNSESEIIQVEGLKCRPCSKIGYEKCPKGHFNCMMKIDDNKIVELTRRFFQ